MNFLNEIVHYVTINVMKRLQYTKTLTEVLYLQVLMLQCSLTNDVQYPSCLIVPTTPGTL